MFGLGDAEKKEEEEFIFDLEREIQDPEKGPVLAKRIDQKVETINGFLRKGEAEEDYELLARMLQGYASLLTVLTEVTKKEKA